MAVRRIVSVVSIVAGSFLLAFCAGCRWYWFEGGPLGVAFLVLGVAELAGAKRVARSHCQNRRDHVVRELRDAVGVREVRASDRRGESSRRDERSS